MGGTIRKDFSTKVTHLIAYSTHGEKYKVSTVTSGAEPGHYYCDGQPIFILYVKI
jgi:hypothetical protein